MTPVTVDPYYVPPVEVDDEACIITVQDLSDYLGKNLSSDDGATFAVEAACDFCRDIAEQHFCLVEDETITLDGSGTDALLLPELPVNEVASVFVDDEAVTDYALSSNGTLLRVTPSVWPAGRQNISVTYSHGYADANLPHSVQAVALAIAARLIVQGVASYESAGDASVRYAVASTDLTANELRILRKHKRAS